MNWILDHPWVAIVIVVAVLGGVVYLTWDKDPVKEGVIIDKAYYSQTIIMQHIYNSSTKTTTLIPIIIPEHWDIVLKGFNSKNEPHQSTYQVSQEEFNRLKIGDSWSVE